MAADGSDAPAPLLTERLLLRPLTADDAGALLRFRAHPAATRYLSHGPLTPAQNRARLEQALSAAAVLHRRVVSLRLGDRAPGHR